MGLFTPLSRLVIALLVVLSVLPAAYAQHEDLPGFLKKKLAWQEKLVVIYAPEDQQNQMKEQIAALSAYIEDLRDANITVVQVPVVLSANNRLYLKNALRYQKNQLNIWVIDEKGHLRMSSTKRATAEQFLRVLDEDTRPVLASRARLL